MDKNHLLSKKMIFLNKQHPYLEVKKNSQKNFYKKDFNENMFLCFYGDIFLFFAEE